MEALNAALEVVRGMKNWPSDQTITIGEGVEGLVRIEIRIASKLQSAIEVRPGEELSAPMVSNEKPKRAKTKEATVSVITENGKESVSAPIHDPKATTPSEEKAVMFQPPPSVRTIEVEMPPPGFTGVEPPAAVPSPPPAPVAPVPPEPKLAVPPGRSYKITIPPNDWKRLDPNQRAKLKRAMRKAAIEPIEANETIHTEAFPGNASGVPELMTLLRELEIGAESTKAA